jgi:hypothetical protein
MILEKGYDISKRLNKGGMEALHDLIRKVQAWWDEVYPEDIFIGVSDDPGAIKVSEIRTLLAKIRIPEPKDAPDGDGLWWVYDPDTRKGTLAYVDGNRVRVWVLSRGIKDYIYVSKHRWIRPIFP